VGTPRNKKFLSLGVQLIDLYGCLFHEWKWDLKKKKHPGYGSIDDSPSSRAFKLLPCFLILGSPIYLVSLRGRHPVDIVETQRI
jgi:hypothetical protein